LEDSSFVLPQIVLVTPIPKENAEDAGFAGFVSIDILQLISRASSSLMKCNANGFRYQLALSKYY
jgi:hypothetical protein